MYLISIYGQVSFWQQLVRFGGRKMIYLGNDWYSERERSRYGSDEEYLDSLEYGGYYDEDDNFHKAE